MKIYTDSIDIEMTMEEFQNILDKGLLDVMITTIASLTLKVGGSKPDKNAITDDETMELLNEIFKDSDVSWSEMDFDEDEGESSDCNEYDEAVNRIYESVFREENSDDL